MNSRLVAATLGIGLFFATLVSFVAPALCAAGCGNLLEPVFAFGYRAFGSWGVRALLLLLAGLFFWVAISRRNRRD